MSDLFGDPADMGADAFAMPGDENFGRQPDPEPAVDAPAEEAAAADRPRDEHGRFVTDEQPEPEAADGDTTAATTEAEESALGRLMAAKSFTDAEQVAQSYLNIEQEAGRLREELGRYRRERDELAAQPQQPQQQQVQAEPQYDPYQLSEWAANLPPTQIPTAAAQAFQQGNDQVMDAVVEAWKEVDPAGARQFERHTVTLRAAALLRAQDTQAQQAQQSVVQTAEQFVAQHPDFEPLAPTMQQIVQEAGMEYVRPLLASQDPQARLAGVTILYEKARDRTQSANLDARSREIAMEHAKQAEQAIKDAAVVTTTAPAAQPAKTRADEIGDEWDALRAPLLNGWNIN